MTDDNRSPVAAISSRSTTGNLEYLHRILHSIVVAELAVAIYCDDDSSREEPVRKICRRNHEGGWATIPLTGDDEEDELAYLVCNGDPSGWPYSYGARPLHGPRRRMGEPIPQVRLDRAQLELIVLAHHLAPRRTRLPDQRVQALALAQAQALLAADRPSALFLVAERLFGGTWAQMLQQLNWLLDGKESNLVVCRHCYHAVDEFDPYLTTDDEDKDARRRREYDSLPRYSAHAACYESFHFFRDS